MREIKFRAWDNKNNHWMFYDLTQRGAIMNLMVIGEGRYVYDDSYHRIIVNNLCQFTGLKDKNGKEIYEGDIVQVNHESDGSHKYEVRYFEGEWRLWNKKYYYGVGILRDSGINGVEIIGNIYDYPELIK